LQAGDAVVASVTAARRAFLEQEFRIAAAEDATVQTTHLLARDPDPLDSALQVKADAEAEAVRQVALFGADRDIYRVRVRTQPFAIDLNDTVEISHGRFGLAAGKRFRVIGLAEDAAESEIEMELFG
ncbi:MAG: hypothetical protein IIC55_08995, partial [Proteobacteria bacterium]|nr:hypothetical protein [Pseudomonadota bacterium]